MTASFTISEATDPIAWDRFLLEQPSSPFLQSWTMGEVYRSIGHIPLRLAVHANDRIVGICQAIVVPARRGKHLAISYGPVLGDIQALPALLDQLKELGKQHGCSFLRMSPFWDARSAGEALLKNAGAKAAPLHLLAEYLWYLPLTIPDPWNAQSSPPPAGEGPGVGASEGAFAIPLTEETLFANLRKTTRNLVRRAEKEGVTVVASKNPTEDLRHFLKLHDETRKRHGFTPYSNTFFQAQVEHFAPRNECTLYLAYYQNEVIASSIHMHLGKETSYHHGASSFAHSKIPASYLLQWTAIRDALTRGDHIYNFWGIAPLKQEEGAEGPTHDRTHPFAGVTTFKTGFGGTLRTLTHCVDVPLSARYYGTRAFECIRKWRRGF